MWQIKPNQIKTTLRKQKYGLWESLKALQCLMIVFHGTKGDDAAKREKASETFHPEQTAGVLRAEGASQGFPFAALRSSRGRKTETWRLLWLRHSVSVCLFSVSILPTLIQSVFEGIGQRKFQTVHLAAQFNGKKKKYTQRKEALKK